MIDVTKWHEAKHQETALPPNCEWEWQLEDKQQKNGSYKRVRNGYRRARAIRGEA